MTPLAIVVYFLLGLATLNAKNLPPPETNFYDVLTKNCPILNLTDPSFKNQDIFQKCNTWQEIEKTTTLTQETTQKVLCLLYYDSFISLCTEVNNKKPSNVTINFVPNLTDYKIEKICKDSALFPSSKTFEHNVNKIISDEGICYKLCLNYDKTVVSECGLAYYFANYNVPATPVVVQSKQAPEITPNAVKPDTKGEVQKTIGIQNQQKNDVEINNPQVNPVVNNEAVASKGSVKTGQAAVLNAKSLTSNATSENKNPPKPLSNDGNSQPVANSNPEAAKGGQTNVITPKDETPQTEGKTQPEAKSQPKNKVEHQAKDGTQVQDASQTKDESQKVTAEDVPDQNAEENVSAVEQAKGEENKGEADLEIDQQNSLDQPGPMTDEDPNLEDGVGNDANYKDDDKKEVNSYAGEKKNEKPNTLAEETPAYNTAEDLDGESYFFSYFMVICVLFVLGYVGYHNRQKVMALMLEGKRGKRQVRSRRPNSANYHKLDSNLEEAISSTCTKNSSHVIY